MKRIPGSGMPKPLALRSISAAAAALVGGLAAFLAIEARQ
jgi:hypothetical protein